MAITIASWYTEISLPRIAAGEIQRYKERDQRYVEALFLSLAQSSAFRGKMIIFEIC
jgi:hypothetical protein